MDLPDEGARQEQGCSDRSEEPLGKKREKMIAPSKPPSFLRRNARKILAGFVFVLLIQDIFGAHGFLAMRRTQKEIQRLRQEIQQVNAENREDRKSVV